MYAKPQKNISYSVMPPLSTKEREELEKASWEMIKEEAAQDLGFGDGKN